MLWLQSNWNGRSKFYQRLTPFNSVDPRGARIDVNAIGSADRLNPATNSISSVRRVEVRRREKDVGRGLNEGRPWVDEQKGRGNYTIEPTEPQARSTRAAASFQHYFRQYGSLVCLLPTVCVPRRGQTVQNPRSRTCMTPCP